MKKHIEALEGRRVYLVQMLDGELPFLPDALMTVFREEKEALDWALGKLEADPERAVWPIGTSGHYGPIRVGDTVQAKIDVKYAEIFAGEVGKLINFDSWAGEEYPYIAAFADGRTAAFAREDIRRVD